MVKAGPPSVVEMCHRLDWSHAALWFLNVGSDCNERKRVTTEQVVVYSTAVKGRGSADAVRSDILNKK